MPFSHPGAKPLRGLAIIVAAVAVAAVAGFTRLETSSCDRSNEVRQPLIDTANTFEAIGRQYQAEAAKGGPEAADKLRRAHNLFVDASSLRVRKLDCSLPFPQR